MAIYVSQLSNTTPLGGVTWLSDAVITDNSAVVGVTVLSDTNLTLNFLWSNTDSPFATVFTDTEAVIASVPFNTNVPVRSQWLKIQLIDGGVNTSLACQGFFFDLASSLLTIRNLGGGAKLLNISKIGLRSLTSNNSSINITTTANEIDLSADVGILLPVNNDVQITESPLGTHNIGIGMNASGTQSIKITRGIGSNDNGNRTVSLGEGAGSSAQGFDSVAVGYEAGKTTQNTQAVAIGAFCGKTTQANGAVSIGYAAGEANQGSNGVAIGFRAADTNQALEAVAIGYVAGETTQGSRAVAIGRQAGSDTQGTRSIAIGAYSGQTNQGSNAVAIGYNCANSTQPANSVAIGSECATPGLAGRLAFGNAMEAVVAYATTAENPVGFIPMEWNGTLYRIPVMSATATQINRAPAYFGARRDALSGLTLTIYVNYLVPLTEKNELNGFTIQNSSTRARCDVPGSFKYLITAGLGVNVVQNELRIYVNGVIQAYTYGNSADFNNLGTLQLIITLAQNDYVELVLHPLTVPAASRTIHGAFLTIMQLTF